MDVIYTIALWLAAVGAVNWGLVGLAKFDLVALICGGLKFGESNAISRILYVVVGVAGVLTIIDKGF